MGLNLPLDGFDVEVHPDRPAALIAVAPHTNIASRLDPGRAETLGGLHWNPRGSRPRQNIPQNVAAMFLSVPLRRCPYGVDAL